MRIEVIEAGGGAIRWKEWMLEEGRRCKKKGGRGREERTGFMRRTYIGIQVT